MADAGRHGVGFFVLVGAEGRQAGRQDRRGEERRECGVRCAALILAFLLELWQRCETEAFADAWIATIVVAPSCLRAVAGVGGVAPVEWVLPRPAVERPALVGRVL